MHNWLDLTQFDSYLNRPPSFSATVNRALADADNTLVCLANFYKHKDHITLFHALIEVKKEHPRTKVLLLGHGPQQSFLQSLAAKLDISNNVVFAGRVCYRWVPKILSMADCGILTSIKETFGQAIIEPLAATKPIISTPVGIAPELSIYKVGLIVPKKDPRSLSSAILQLIENPKELKAMGLRGRH